LVRPESKAISEVERFAWEHGRAYRLHTKERRLVGQLCDQVTGLLRKLAAPEVMIRTSSGRKVVSVPRETEGKEMDVGSLSILIVLIESREIWTAESR
jgi:hypothetical protein